MSKGTLVAIKPTRETAPTPNAFADAASAIAKRFGVSAKALRVYERMGLIAPARTGAGWRIYGQREIERLAAIVALKQLGLPLKRIKTLLTGEGDLAAALALQEAALVETKTATDEALTLVRAARTRLSQKATLSPDEIANLIRRSKMTNFKWTPKLEEMAEKHYTQDQLAALRARPFTEADQVRVNAAWSDVYADIEKLGANVDPTSEKALAIGRRAFALINEFTLGDPALLKAAGAMKTEMMKDPAIVDQFGPTKQTFDTLNRIMVELRKRGELPV